MYIYLILQHHDDGGKYLASIACTSQEADTKLSTLQKNNTNSFKILRKRVNSKECFFVVSHKYEEADCIFYDFLHLSTSEKRANGYKKHLVQTKFLSANDIVVNQY
jgi:hypothetical protein